MDRTHMKALEIKNLHKSFKSNFLLKNYHILKGIEMSVEKGEIYGFLGPNGAGKTTTMKCILGLLTPDSGQISILGQPGNHTQTRKNIGFLPEHPYFYDYLTPEELLQFSGMLFSIPPSKIREKSNQLLELVGLANKKDIKLRKFSKGMVQRVGLAQSLINDPDFIILDEPFSGLDPIGRKELRDIILSLKTAGKTVFFSSHILQDMELMVDRVGIILDGKIKREGKLSDLVSRTVRYYEIVFSGISREIFANNPHPVDLRIQDNNFIATVETVEDSNEFIKWIYQNNGKIVSVTPVKRTLEDIFLEEIQK